MDQDSTWHEGRPLSRRLCVKWGLSPRLPRKGGAPSQISAHFYCGQTAGCITMLLGMDVGLSLGDFVLDGVPIFGPSLLWPNGWMDQDATWHEGRPQPRRLCVRWGTSLGLHDIVFDVEPATPEKGTPTRNQFLAHVYCGQMDGWMKTPLGTEVDLGPGHTVLYGVPVPVKGAQQPPLFGPCLLWPRSPISATAEMLYFLYCFLLKYL